MDTNTYNLRSISASVGYFGEYDTFEQLIDDLLEKQGYIKVCNLLDFGSLSDLVNNLAGKDGKFSEQKARELCMDKLDGVIDPESSFNFKGQWEDYMYDRAVGK